MDQKPTRCFPIVVRGCLTRPYMPAFPSSSPRRWFPRISARGGASTLPQLAPSGALWPG